MTANPVSTPRRKRFATAAALVAAVAAGTTLVVPAASAAPANTGLLLTAAQFPAGSGDYRSGGTPRTQISGGDNASPQCIAATARVNRAQDSSQGVSASARNGYSYMLTSLRTPAQTPVWRAAALACGGPIAELPVPGDLARYNPVVVTYQKAGRTGAIEGVADVNGITVDVYVSGLSETPANSARFWQVFRAQVQKVQAGR